MTSVHFTYRGRLIVVDCRGPDRWHYDVVPPAAGATSDRAPATGGPFDSVTAALVAARGEIDDRLRQTTDPAFLEAGFGPTPPADGDWPLMTASEATDLTLLSLEDRRRVARHVTHRVANAAQLLAGRVYMEEAKAIAGCPILQVARDTVARLERLLADLHALGEFGAAPRVWAHRRGDCDPVHDDPKSR
jgi:hypothetical protein